MKGYILLHESHMPQLRLQNIKTKKKDNESRRNACELLCFFGDDLIRGRSLARGYFGGNVRSLTYRTGRSWDHEYLRHDAPRVARGKLFTDSHAEAAAQDGCGSR